MRELCVLMLAVAGEQCAIAGVQPLVVGGA